MVKIKLEVVIPRGSRTNMRQCAMSLKSTDAVLLAGDSENKRDHLGRCPVLIEHSQEVAGLIEVFKIILWPELISKIEPGTIEIGWDYADGLRANNRGIVQVSPADESLWKIAKEVHWQLDTPTDAKTMQSLLKSVPKETRDMFVRVNPPQSFMFQDMIMLKINTAKPNSKFIRITEDTSQSVMISPDSMITDTLLLIDATKSMNRSDGGKYAPSRFKVVLDAISKFFEIKGRQVGLDRVGIRLFTDHILDGPDQVLPLTNCDSEFKDELGEFLSKLNWQKRGWTSISDAVVEGVRILAKKSEDTKAKLILLLTDGMHAVTTASYVQKYPKRKHPSLEYAFSFAKENGVFVSLLVIGDPSKLNPDKLKYLYSLVESTGGSIEEPQESKHLLSLYSALAEGYIVKM